MTPAKLGGATIVLALLRSIIVVALTLGAAAALTHYVTLPEPLGTMTWIIAGCYSAFVIGVTALVVVAFLVTASAQDTVIRRMAPRGRKLR